MRRIRNRSRSEKYGIVIGKQITTKPPSSAQSTNKNGAVIGSNNQSSSAFCGTGCRIGIHMGGKLRMRAQFSATTAPAVKLLLYFKIPRPQKLICLAGF